MALIWISRAAISETEDNALTNEIGTQSADRKRFERLAIPIMATHTAITTSAEYTCSHQTNSISYFKSWL
jgi:hypothetical protein